MDMSIQKYMAFVKTAEYGSFTKAAEILQYSQSGISRMIHDLEEEWNVVLLERGRAGVRLTSDGVRLLERAKGICVEYEKLRQEVEELNGLESGLIRIGTFSSVATHWLPYLIEGFQKKYPNIQYEFLIGDYTEIEHWIAIGRVDCGFLRLPTDPAYETIEMKDDPFMAVLPREIPREASGKEDKKTDSAKGTKERFHITEFDGAEFLLLEKEENTEVSDVLKKYHINPNIRVTTWDDYSIMSMVERGIGYAILPELILKRVPYEVDIRPLDVHAYRKIGLAYKGRASASAAMRRFMEYIVENAGRIRDYL